MIVRRQTKAGHFNKTLLAVALPLAVAPAHAAIITVNNGGDGSAGCTLREAVATTNANMNLGNGCGGSGFTPIDTIVIGVNAVALRNGELELSDDIEITSPTNSATIDAAGTSRIFSINSAKVTLSDLTLTGGDSSNGGTPKVFNEGGAIYVDSGTLTVERCIIRGNSAIDDAGGAIASRGTVIAINNSRIYDNSAYSSGGVLSFSNSTRIVNSQITSNTATNRGAGGVYISSETMTLNGATISNNSAISVAGGIRLTDSSGTIRNSTINNNVVDSEIDGADVFGGRGGGLNTETSIISIFKTEISGNTASGSGGGLYGIASEIELTDSSITSNRALAEGEASTALGGGGVLLTMRDSSFSGLNSAIRFTQSTIANNFSARDGGGVLLAPQAGNGSVSSLLLNATISNNSATYIGGGVRAINDSALGSYAATISENRSGFGAGGVAAQGAAATVVFANSIVSGNTSDFTAQEIRFSSGASLEDAQNNVFGQRQFTNLQSFYGIPINNDNIFATSNGDSPSKLRDIIGPLTNNGGPTRTHALATDSIAIDQGNTEICNFVAGRDQRGAGNRTDGQCDIGSVEFFENEESCFVVPLQNGGATVFCL